MADTHAVQCLTVADTNPSDSLPLSTLPPKQSRHNMLLRSQAISSLAPIMEYCPLAWNTAYMAPTLPPLHVHTVVAHHRAQHQACKEHVRLICTGIAFSPQLLDRLGVAHATADFTRRAKSMHAKLEREEQRRPPYSSAASMLRLTDGVRGGRAPTLDWRPALTPRRARGRARRSGPGWRARRPRAKLGGEPYSSAGSGSRSTERTWMACVEAARQMGCRPLCTMPTCCPPRRYPRLFSSWIALRRGTHARACQRRLPHEQRAGRMRLQPPPS